MCMISTLPPKVYSEGNPRCHATCLDAFAAETLLLMFSSLLPTPMPCFPRNQKVQNVLQADVVRRALVQVF